MKKFLAITVAALLILSLAGCADKKDEDVLDDEETVNADDGYSNAAGTFEFELNDEGDLEIVRFTPKGADLVDVTLPSSYDKRDVVGIAEEVFKGQTCIKSVTIPNTYEYISSFAFYDCEYLTSVKTAGTVKTIGKNAFAKCKSLVSFEGLAKVEAIEDYAFMDCTSLKSADLSANVASIGQGTFAGCAALESVTLSDKLTSIGVGAFQGCDALKYENDGNCSYLGTAANKYFAAIRAVDYNVEECSLNDATVIVSLDAFANCAHLDKITVGDGLKIMNGSALNNSVKLSFNVYKDNALYLGTDSNPYEVLVKFKVNTNDDFDISGDTKIILDTAFENCMNLESIHFGGEEADWNKVIKTENWSFGKEPAMAYGAAEETPDSGEETPDNGEETPEGGEETPDDTPNTSTAPNANYEDMKTVLEGKGYTVVVVTDTVSLSALGTDLGVNNLRACVTASKEADTANDEAAQSITVYYFESETDAKIGLHAIKALNSENPEGNMLVGQKGDMAWMGTATALQDSSETPAAA